MVHVLRRQPDVELLALATTFNAQADRVAMHAVRRTLVERQAAELGLPLWPVELPWPCANGVYEELLQHVLQRGRETGATHFAFGDLFLEDIREYRVQLLQGSGLEPLFPIWCGAEGTGALAEAMIQSGLRAILTCVDPRACPAEFAGREFNAELLHALPASVDPCGERGEFHTFCFAGPLFHAPIEVETGETSERDGFLFTDVRPATTTDLSGFGPRAAIPALSEAPRHRPA
jgi:diphthamide synthase (EF-2-diphthine--ammonia ligase)